MTVDLIGWKNVDDGYDSYNIFTCLSDKSVFNINAVVFNVLKEATKISDICYHYFALGSNGQFDDAYVRINFK